MANLTFIQALARTAKHAYDAVIIKMSSVLESYVEKEAGKGLSTNDYTTTEKNKLAGIQAKATHNDTLYKSSVASTVTVGGIAKGYTPPESGVEVKDMIDKLLHPYVAPSGITAQMLPTNGGVVEKGTTQTITGVKVSWTAGSASVMQIDVKNGSTTLKSINGGVSSRYDCYIGQSIVCNDRHTAYDCIN